MAPIPAVSPTPKTRNILLNRTNSLEVSQTSLKSWFSSPGSSQERVPKRSSEPSNKDATSNKRVKIQIDEDYSSSSSEDSDGDMGAARIASTGRRTQRYPYLGPVASRLGNAHLPPTFTTHILESFVSSHKSDVFKCQSTDANTFLTPPYACSYTHGAKRGGPPLLAVATEQGTVNVFNTAKRDDWDVEPLRMMSQPHHNGVFDVKWNMADELFATCSGDQSTRITCPARNITTHTLRGHTSTVKCVAWDPVHHDLLSTGGRDGSICIWDLRIAGTSITNGPTVLDPVMTLFGAHNKTKTRTRSGKTSLSTRSVTNVLYPNSDPYGLVSSGSFDGILQYWDLRAPAASDKTRSIKPKAPATVHTSCLDPTTLHGSRRPRGTIRLVSGVGPTAGLLFAIGADSRIHTFTLPDLTPQKLGYVHDHLQASNFYVGLAMSPCGRWLACGGTGSKGSNFLFDVSNAAHPGSAPRRGVELKGHHGEVGAVDWAEGVLATCADDGTVRVWRPDIEIYRQCQSDPEEKKWEWCWSVQEHSSSLGTV
ncbi:WD40-repeat-containing domain protein [Infundibulicybe gibba]|nr:WD40-repeat-containing domain protein [Infundibulicybe gibba]